MVKFGLCGPISDFCQHNLNFDERKVRDHLQKKTALSGGKNEKKLFNFFLRLCDTYEKYTLQKNGSKRPFQSSAVTRAIYKRLYRVATTN